MEEKKKILYIGLDINTPFLLSKEKTFEVIATSYVNDFNKISYNPINYIFKWIYSLRRNEKFYFLEYLLVKIWIILNFVSSSIYSKYKDYLILISEKKIKLVDVDEDENTVDFIKINKIDLVVIDFWGMLKKNVLLAPKYKTVNIHPSKLPKYRGALPTLWALRNHDKESAVDYILLEESMDTGKIIGQHTFFLEKDDNWFSVEMKIKKIKEMTLIKDLKDYLSGKTIPFVQDLSDASKTGRYDEYLAINWKNEDAIDIYNKINLYPFLEFGIYCYTYYMGRKIHIKKARLVSNLSVSKNMEGGQFVFKNLSLLVKARSGFIVLRAFRSVSLLDGLFIYINRKNNIFK